MSSNIVRGEVIPSFGTKHPFLAVIYHADGSTMTTHKVPSIVEGEAWIVEILTALRKKAEEDDNV